MSGNTDQNYVVFKFTKASKHVRMPGTNLKAIKFNNI